MNERQNELKKELINNALKACEIRRETYQQLGVSPLVNKIAPNEEYYMLVNFLGQTYLTKSRFDPKQNQDLKNAMMKDIKWQIYDEHKLN